MLRNFLPILKKIKIKIQQVVSQCYQPTTNRYIKSSQPSRFIVQHSEQIEKKEPHHVWFEW